jgi:hypothetical protein
VQSTAAGLPPIFRGYLAKWTNIAGGYKVSAAACALHRTC